jgi:hypothetical protein
MLAGVGIESIAAIIGAITGVLALSAGVSHFVNSKREEVITDRRLKDMAYGYKDQFGVVHDGTLQQAADHMGDKGRHLHLPEASER